MKKTLVFCLMLFVYQAVAYGQSKSLIMKMNDGTTHEFLLKDRPIVSVDDTYQRLTVSTDLISLEYALQDVKEYSFAASSGISNIENNKLVELLDNMVVLNGKYSKSDIIVSDISGKRLNVDVNLFSDKVVVSLSALPKGVYIVKANDLIIKMSKK